MDEASAHATLAFVAQRAAPPPNHDLLFVGMSDSALTELSAIERGAKGEVSAVIGSASTVVRAPDGQVCNVDTYEGRRRFAATLGLPSPQAVEDALEKAPPDGRNELAQIALVWAKAEQGLAVPSRLVLSGHGWMSDVHGAGGSLPFESLARLAQAMPSAARQIEHVFVSACFQGQPARMQAIVDMFPNLKTASGYEEFAPQNDTHNLRAWEASTRVHREVRPPIAGANVWTRHGGFAHEEKSASIRSDVQRMELVFTDAFLGDERVRDPHQGPVCAYYQSLQRLLGCRDLSPAERATWTERARQTYCLRFYATLRTNFDADHGQAIKDACARIGLAPPRFDQLDRKGALAAIADLEPKMPPDVARALRGLRDLDPSIVEVDR
jgi:hypothetical protein